MTIRPFAEYWKAYREAGWNVLPIVPGKKYCPLRGVTGREGRDLSDEDCEAIAAGKYGGFGIGVRMPDGVLGLDTDAYPGKTGGETLAALEEECGILPPTWRSNARGDGISGIRFFRVPDGFKAIGSFGEDSGIEIIQRTHRLAVVFPTINPKCDSRYQWYSPDNQLNNDVPTVKDLPWIGSTNYESRN